MKKLLLTLTLLASASGVFAGEPIVTTVISRSTLGTNVIGSVPVFAWIGETNVIDISNGQAARVASAWPNFYYQGAPLPLANAQLIKNGSVWPVSRGDVIQGPARITLWQFTHLAGEVAVGQPSVASPEPIMLTVERWTVRKATPAQLAQ